MTIQTPTGWTKVLDSAVDANLRQATFYRVIQSGDPGSVTFAFGGAAPVQRAVGGATAYYGVKASAVVDTLASAVSTGNSGTATAAGITTTRPDSIVVTAFAAATGGAISTPSGTTERYDDPSGSTSAQRSRAASHSFVQTAAGSTGAKASSISSSRWFAHLMAFAVDDVAPTVSIGDPGTNLRQTITLQASASDADSGVVNVRFQRAPAGTVTWTNIGNLDTAAPYSVSFNTTSVADGLYDFRAVATDNAGNTSAAVTSSERIDNGAPALTLTFPCRLGVAQRRELGGRLRSRRFLWHGRRYGIGPRLRRVLASTLVKRALLERQRILCLGRDVHRRIVRGRSMDGAVPEVVVPG